MEDNKAMRSKCCGERIQFPKEAKRIMRKLEISKEEEEALCELLSGEIGVCPHCSSAGRRERSKIFHAAHQLLNYIKKGMIITIAIVILLPTLLLVLMITHVIRIEHKIKLIPILRIRDDLSLKDKI